MIFAIIKQTKKKKKNPEYPIIFKIIFLSKLYRSSSIKESFCAGNWDGAILTSGRPLGRSRGIFAGNRGRKLALV